MKKYGEPEKSLAGRRTVCFVNTEALIDCGEKLQFSRVVERVPPQEPPDRINKSTGFFTPYEVSHVGGFFLR